MDLICLPDRSSSALLPEMKKGNDREAKTFERKKKAGG